MKPTAIMKICMDVMMYSLFLLLMGQYLLRDAPHEWLGITAGIFFILHNVLNYKWYKAMFRGRYNAIRIVQTAVNILLLLAVLGCVISGIFASQYIFSVGNAHHRAWQISASCNNRVGVYPYVGTFGTALDKIDRAGQKSPHEPQS